MPQAQVETCLAELRQELAKLSVVANSLRDPYGRGCLEVRGRHGNVMLVHVLPQFFWFVWGTGPEERHSVFRPTESALLIAKAVGQRRSAQIEQPDLRFTLDRFLR
ncbi:MAG: hypothetical protein ABIQ26_22405 [Streptosporangiaceae bacterium]